MDAIIIEPAAKTAKARFDCFIATTPWGKDTRKAFMAVSTDM
jgi:hypothetical protein